jgi:endonuclease/exonuclease/phosphatase family metal-dependent hydrolase
MKRLFFSLVFIILSNILMLAQLETAMTFNIRLDTESDKENNWHYRKAKLVELIKFYQPDILGIQEALANQMDYLDSSLTDYDFVGVGRDDGKKAGEYSALFYNSKKFTVIKSNTFWLSETPEKVSFGWDAACRRVCTYALLENKLTKKQFWAFNTHFDHQGEKARIESMNLIVLKINQLTKSSKPVVLMGDLNMTPEHESIKTITKLLEDASSISKSKAYGPVGTFIGFDVNAIADKRLDYVFVSGLKVSRYRHIEDRRKNNLPISDHLPVMVKFISQN